jgi:putative flippase GtrA
LKSWIQARLKEFLKFGSVGLIGLVIDVGLFNVLVLLDTPTLLAKTISMSIAIVFAFLGNKLWAFSHRTINSLGEKTGHSVRKEFILFLLFNMIALGISLSCLYISEHILGLTSILADNISGNVIGLGLGTLFRFHAYRTWVFPNADTENEKKALIYSSEV